MSLGLHVHMGMYDIHDKIWLRGKILRQVHIPRPANVNSNYIKEISVCGPQVVLENAIWPLANKGCAPLFLDVHWHINCKSCAMMPTCLDFAESLQIYSPYSIF